MVLDPELRTRLAKSVPAKSTSSEAAQDDPRSDFDRDFARVIHSGAFRRLQGKSQVVHAGHADFFRTRLTHTLEVAQIGEAIADMLVPRDPELRSLVRVACLVHDLGHPPFGHNGENALKDWANLHGSSFEANAQSFRIVTHLETKYPPSLSEPASVGLDLTLGSLVASTKYPWTRGAPGTKQHRKFGIYEEDIAASVPVVHYLERAPKTATGLPQKHAAASIMDWADDVAYSVHDLEDGIRARLIPLAYLRSPDGAAKREVIAKLAKDEYGSPYSHGDLLAILRDLLTSEYFAWCVGPYEHSNEHRGRIKMMTSGLIDRFVRGISLAGNVARCESDLIFDPAIEAEIALLKAVHWHYVVSSRELQTMQYRERRIVTDLANAIFADGDRLLPTEHLAAHEEALSEDLAELDWDRDTWRELVHAGETTAGARVARVVCDYISGMTDRYADRLHARMLGAGPGNITDLI
jgi:dGTPase